MKTQKEKFSPLVKKPSNPAEDKQPTQEQGQSTSTNRPKPTQRPNYLLRLL